MGGEVGSIGVLGTPVSARPSLRLRGPVGGCEWYWVGAAADLERGKAPFTGSALKRKVAEVAVAPALLARCPFHLLSRLP